MQRNPVVCPRNLFCDGLRVKLEGFFGGEGVRCNIAWHQQSVSLVQWILVDGKVFDEAVNVAV